MVARKVGKMERELYKELTLKDIDKELEFFGLSEETRAKVMEWGEKKALADYIEGKWRFV